MPLHTPPQLFLIDGYALIYRAFYALIARPLRTARGENTSAVWGVTNFLFRLREKYQPDYLVWINDAGDSFRTEEFAEYKSTREKLDDELQADFDRAVERVRSLLRGFRIPLVEVPGYEADDVIGTLAARAADAGLQAVIVSGDKDFYQLIRPGVALLNPGRGGPAGVDEVWVTEANATERLGVPPHQVVDWLALVGDSSDNIPGVKGIGEKGAVQLLQEFGDLETMIARAAEIKQKRPREALQQQADAARLSRRLVTIRCDVPVDLDLATLTPQPPDTAQLAKLFVELEFNSLLPKLSQVGDGSGSDAPAASGGSDSPAAQGAPPSVNCNAVTVRDPAEIPALIDELRAAPLVAFDTRTSGSDPRTTDLVGISLAVSSDRVWYLPLAHRTSPGTMGEDPGNLPPLTDPLMEPLRRLLEDESVPKAGHDVKFDVQVLRRLGIELRGVVFDAMLASFVLDPSRRSHQIDALSVEFLNARMTPYEEIAGKGRTQLPFAEVAVARAAAYCGAESGAVLSLHQQFGPEIERAAVAPLLSEIEMPLVPVLTDMEWTGIRIDPVVFRDLDAELNRDLDQIAGDIARVAGTELNINSPRQLAVVLFEQQGLPVLKKTRTGPSTDAEVLEALAEQGHELPRLILAHRELQKLKSTYVDVLPSAINPATGRIHTSFNQVGAQTGRLSSSEPNLQNIPVRTPRGEAIRRGFVPEPGWKFVVADYSQIELRLMAHLSEDPAFVDAFRQGHDIHRQTAAIIFGVPLDEVTSEMRGRAKTTNFAVIYGQGPFALSKKLGFSLDEARQFIADYFARFIGVRGYLDRQIDLARRQGYVETLFGRRRYIPEIRDRNFNIRAFGERTAQNTPLQGSAADLIKIAMVRIHRALPAAGLRARMVLQVHDELIIEAPADQAAEAGEIVKHHMEGAAKLNVPLEVGIGIGDNWVDAKKD